MTVEPADVRDLSEDEEQERAEKCAEIEQRIKENLQHGRQAFWELARNLYEFDQENGWTALGFSSQEEWLAQPEVSMTRSAFFGLVRRHRELVVARKLPSTQLVALEPSKVDIVMPAIEKNRGKLQDILDDVRDLGARDLRDKYVLPYVRARGTATAEDNGAPEGGATTVETDDVPVNAADVVVDGTAQEAGELDLAVMHAAAVVDSWFELGGDRRKAKRNWAKLQEIHPILAAVHTIGAAVEGGEDAPSRTDGFGAWAILCDALSIQIEEG